MTTKAEALEAVTRMCAALADAGEWEHRDGGARAHARQHLAWEAMVVVGLLKDAYWDAARDGAEQVIAMLREAEGLEGAGPMDFGYFRVRP